MNYELLISYSVRAIYNDISRSIFSLSRYWIGVGGINNTTYRI